MLVASFLMVIMGLSFMTITGIAIRRELNALKQTSNQTLQAAVQLSEFGKLELVEGKLKAGDASKYVEVTTDGAGVCYTLYGRGCAYTRDLNEAINFLSGDA